MGGAIPKNYGTPRRYKRRRPVEIETEPLELFISVRPTSSELGARMLAFLKAHYQDWHALIGERREASPPRKGRYQAPRGEILTLEFHYTPHISELEAQYIASLARWVALRIGTVRERTVGRVSETANRQGHLPERKMKYAVPCLYYNGIEKCLVVRQELWKHPLTPDQMGVGTLCDEHGFQSREHIRQQQTMHYVQSINGIVLLATRKMREKEQRVETLIHNELRRLSDLWSI